ncbi:hypothetical protein C6366_17595 [Desulfonatronum sp. SC1]|nr:hypothetical protein C6366_17595 [Desulfonatronum sp. SC1]
MLHALTTIANAQHTLHSTPLKPGGHVLLTMKQGEGTSRAEDGRVFVLWRDEDLRGGAQIWGLRWWMRLSMRRYWVRGRYGWYVLRAVKQASNG